MLDAVEHAVMERFVQTPLRASVSFVGVDQIDVLRVDEQGERVYVTLGMSRYPMTSAQDEVVAENGPRAELLLRMRDPHDRYTDVWRRLALLAATPAVEGVVYRPEMTVDIGEPLAPGSQWVGVLVTTSDLPPVQTSHGPVEMLAVVPATSVELAWCRVHGATALHERWATQHTDLLDPARRSVTLD